MNGTKRLITVFASMLGVLLVLVVGTAFFLHVGPFARAAAPDAAPAPQDLGPLIATVDGQPIYLGEAKSRLEGLSTVHGDPIATLGKHWPEQILQSLVSDKVIRAEAASRGITATDADKQEWLGQIQSMLGPGQTIESWLAEQGISYQELMRRIELQIIATHVYNAVTADVTVSSKELHRYYRTHRAEFEGVDGHVSSFIEVRNSLRESMRKQKQEEAYTSWLDEAKSEVDVQIVMKDWWRSLS